MKQGCGCFRFTYFLIGECFDILDKIERENLSFIYEHIETEKKRRMGGKGKIGGSKRENSCNQLWEFVLEVSAS